MQQSKRKSDLISENSRICNGSSKEGALEPDLTCLHDSEESLEFLNISKLASLHLVCVCVFG